ncbi:MAG: 30S ribosomal protein S3 [Candidatus Bathyarchaeota archaeon]|nr:30S ribosomal protein S3 [Candidatus Bathyarchaeum sp.]
MSVVKHFIEDSIKKTEIDEFLQNEFERAGYGGVSITKTPLGTHLVIYTMRPGLVIGRGGETIRALASILEEKFQLPSPQISVAEIEIPELNAHVVASRIASALKRGIHYRRAGFWGLTQAMQAGALGIEIIISGKLRTDRARYEKFREGYLPKSGEPPRRYMRKAELHVHLKPGTLGVKVSLLPPDAVFPDQINVHVIEEDLEREPERVVIEEKALPEEKVAEPAVSPVEETIESPEKEAKPKAPSEDKAITETKEDSVEKLEPKKKVEDVKAPAVEAKVEPEKKVAKTEAAPVEKKIEKQVAEKPVVPTEPKTVPVVEKTAVATKKVAATKAPSTPKKTEDKKVTKPEPKPVEKTVVPEKKASKNDAEKTTPAKEKKAAKKEVATTEAPAKEKKEAGK